MTKRLRWRFVATLAPARAVMTLGRPLPAQTPVTLTVHADRPGARIDPRFYGLMTEEINFSYDGGLYAELIRNRTFRDDPRTPVHWSLVKYGGGASPKSLHENRLSASDLN